MNALKGFMPRLSILEWSIFILIAAMLSVTNIYTTLLTGWGDGGSIIAVLASVLFLRTLGSKKKLTVETLNLGQTLASAGGSVGFSVCAYAAVKMLEPKMEISVGMMILLFIAMGIIGTVLGTSVRKYMVRYFFPSGTACAVIQKTVTSEDEVSAKRPIRILSIFGALAGLLTIPTKIAFKKGSGAVFSSISFHKKLGLGLSLDPLLYGIGIVVGPRIGLGMMIGALCAPFVIIPTLKSNGFSPKVYGDWVKWMAIAVLTLPTFATILFAYFFRTEANNPAGFTPGTNTYERPPAFKIVLIALALIGTLVTAITINILFYVPWYMTILTVAISWPLCIMNGRVTGDTDINPVRLVAIVILTAFAFMVSGPKSAVILLGMAIIGGTLAGMGVDMMQDYRTGYLVDANHYHQTTVQIVGSVIGSIVAVPFIIYLESAYGFGAKTTLKAPGAQIWSAMAKAFAGNASLGTELIWAIVIVSIVFSALSYLTVWPKTAAYMPSLFGLGIGLLLPFDMCAAIFIGGLIKWVVTSAYKSKAEDDEGKAKMQTEAANDTMLVGSSMFAAAAVVSVLVVILNALFPTVIFLAH